MGVVIATAIRGRHIIEAISWGLLVANLGPEAIDTLATIRVTSFDAQQHRGKAEWQQAT